MTSRDILLSLSTFFPKFAKVAVSNLISYFHNIISLPLCFAFLLTEVLEPGAARVSILSLLLDLRFQREVGSCLLFVQATYFPQPKISTFFPQSKQNTFATKLMNLCCLYLRCLVCVKFSDHLTFKWLSTLLINWKESPSLDHCS